MVLDRSQVPQAGNWKSLNALSDQTLTAIESLGFQEMTPVQASTIPLFLQNKDVVVEAVTGSGKTLAFLIPVLEILYRRSEPLRKLQIGAVIISPTRELAKQIHLVLSHFLSHGDGNLKSILLTGGRPVEEDIQELQEHGASIIVATPGKLEEILKASIVCTKELEVLILDEADRLLDLGFEKSLREIIGKLPKQRRTGLFSATMTDALSELIKAGLRNPVRIVVKVEDKVTNAVQRIPSTLSIGYVECESNEKLPLMLSYITANPGKKFIVYFCTCSCVDYFYKVMTILPQLKNIPIFSLHGKMNPKRRIAVYDGFVASDAGVLLCTDVASRGLDIPDVDFVIQIDPPQDPQAFLHRCGRTARQGKTGKAMVFLLPQENAYVDFLALRKIPISAESVRPVAGLDGIGYPAVGVPAFYSSPNVVDGRIAKPTLHEFIHAHMMEDRDFYQKSIVAFVSFIKSYQEHQLKFIFRFKKLDFGRLLDAFFLLRVPKSFELKQFSWQIQQSPDFKERISEKDADSIAFKDKQREQQRLENAKKERKQQAKRKMDAWSDKKAAKDRKLERREKKLRKKQFLANQKMQTEQQQQQQQSNDGANKRDLSDDEDMDDDWEELQKEARLMKKLKTGKITKEEFETVISDSDNDSE